MTVVVAAGNSGPNSETIMSPGNSSSVITVGAINDRNARASNDYPIAPFSSRGPTKEGLEKPDLVAPGVNINSLSNTNLSGYKSLSGTSMATPMVSGSLAVLLSKDNNLNTDQLRTKILECCTNLDKNIEEQGVGLVDIGKLFEKTKTYRRRPFNKPASNPIEIIDNKGDKNYKPSAASNSTNAVFIILLILLFLRV